MDCKTKKCGCLDTGLTTPTPCAHDTLACPNPDPCSETFSDCCVRHSGDTIVDINILKGEPLCVTLQKLALLITNPGCILPGATCQSTVNFHSTSISSSTINLAWDAVTVATSYTVEYREISALSWLLNPSVAILAYPVDIVGGLLPSTSYYLRVNTICASGTCYSVTLLITTKPS